MLHRFADLAISRLSDTVGTHGTSSAGQPLDVQVLGMALVGATNELLIDHVVGVSPVEIDVLTEHVLAVTMALGALASGQSPAP